MDKTKVKIDLMNATQATDKLEAAIAAYDHKQIGEQLWRLRQALENLQTDTGVKLEFMNLKADQNPIKNVCQRCGENPATIGDLCKRCNTLEMNALK